MTLKVEQIYPVFNDIDGQPVDDGYIYIGEYGQNPEVSPVTAYWDEDLTIPAAQPIRTINGYPSRSGSAAALFIAGVQYSITVRNKNGSLIHSDLTKQDKTNGVQIVSDKAAAVLIQPTTTRNLFVRGNGGGLFYGVIGAAPGTYADNESSLCGSVFIPTGGDGSSAWLRAGNVIEETTVAIMKLGFHSSGQIVKTRGYHAANDGGNAEYLIKTSAEYGGTPDEYGDHTLANGNVAVLQVVGAVNVKQFGAKGDGINNDYDAINAAATFAAASTRNRAVVFYHGTYRSDSKIGWPNVALLTVGQVMLDLRGGTPTFYSTERWTNIKIGDRGLIMTHENNTRVGQNLYIMDIKYGAYNCKIKGNLIALNGVTKFALIFRGENPDDASANSSMYDNEFDLYIKESTRTEITGKGIHFYGKGATGKTLNFNKIKGIVSDFSELIYVEEGGSNEIDADLGTCSGTAVHFSASTAESANNVLRGGYFDGVITGDRVKLTCTHTSTLHMLDILGVNGAVRNRNELPVLAGSGKEFISYGIFGENFNKAGRKPTVDKTAGFGVELSDAGTTMTNAGATGTLLFQLPSIATLGASVVGCEFTFSRQASQTLQIDPDGTETIRGGGAGKYLSLDSDGAHVTLRCDSSSNLVWEIVSSYGTITYEP